MGLERELVALLGLLADREQAHVRLGHAQDLLREDGAHVAELEQVVGSGVRVRAGVEEHRWPAAGRDRDCDRGAMDTPDPAQLEQGRGEHRTGVPRGDDRVRPTLRDEAAGDDERALRLRTDRLGGLLVHADRVASLHELEPTRGEVRRPHEDGLDRVGPGEPRAFDDLRRAAIAAHGVYGDARRGVRAVYGAGVRSGSMSRPR